MKGFLRFLSLVLLTLNTAGALYGGGSLVIDSSGHQLGLPAQWLEHTPFTNFLIPGISLLLINGVFGLWVIVYVLKKNIAYPLLLCVQGGLLVAWIIIEYLLTQLYDPLQLIMLVIGLLLILTGSRLRLLERKNNPSSHF